MHLSPLARHIAGNMAQLVWYMSPDTAQVVPHLFWYRTSCAGFVRLRHNLCRTCLCYGTMCAGALRLRHKLCRNCFFTAQFVPWSFSSPVIYILVFFGQK